MADDKKTVEIEILADAKKFRAELKQTAKEAKEFSSTSRTANKAGIKEDKTFQKISKDFIKFNKQENIKALQMEKQLQSVMKQKVHTLRDLSKQGKINTEEFKKEQKALKDTAKLYSDIKRNRVLVFGDNKKEEVSTGKIAGGAFLGSIAAQAFGAVVGAVKGRITDAIEAANEYNTASIQSLGDKRFTPFARSQAQDLGKTAGFTNTEVMQQAAAVVRQTGNAADAGTSLQFSRAAMIDQGKSAAFMGMQARGGILSAQAKREQEKIIAAGFASGIQRGRFGEFLQGVTGLAEAAQSRTAGTVAAGDYAGLLAALGRSGKPGLQGARGAAVLQQLEQGVMAPGAGEAGQALIMRSKGFGTPSGTTDYYQALRRQQMGFAGERGAGELKAFIDQLQVEFGKNSEASVLAGSRTTGVSIPVMEEVIKLVNNFSGDSKDLKKQIAELTKESLPLEEQVRDILDDKIAESLKTQVNISNTLVRQGQDLLPISLEIKVMIDTLVTRVTDEVIPALLAIRDIVKDSYNFFVRQDMYSDLKESGRLEVEKYKALAGDDPKKLIEFAEKNIKMLDDQLTTPAATMFGGNQDLIRSISDQKKAFLDLKDEAASKLGLYDSKPKPFDSRAAARSLSPKEIEEAVARGTAKGSKENQPLINIPAPVVKNIIIAPDGSYIQHR